MKIAPADQLNDGCLNIVILKEFHKVELLFNLPCVYKGTHITHPKVSCFQGQKIEITSADKFLEMDGETPGTGECQFEMRPGELKVVIP